MKYQYQFPELRWVPKNKQDHIDQVAEISGEVDEAMDETDECDVDYAMELFDVIHATETALRGLPSDVVETAYEHVIDKNIDRAYYKLPIQLWKTSPEGPEPIEKRRYYDDANISTIDVIKAVVEGLSGFDAALLATIIKYVRRAGKKPGESPESDLTKANDYAHMLVTGTWAHDKETVHEKEKV